MLQFLLEDVRNGTVCRPVLIADKRIIVHGTKIASIRLKCLYKIADVLQHRLCAMIAVLWFSRKGMGYDRLHSIYQMRGTINFTEIEFC